MIKIKYSQHNRFDRQLKKLMRKYHSLNEDLDIAKRYSIEAYHIDDKNNESIWLIPQFDTKTIKIYKIKKFSCRTLKGKGVKSGIRIIYAFYPEKLEIEFLEIYYKEKKDSNMDFDFIKKYLIMTESP